MILVIYSYIFVRGALTLESVTNAVELIATARVKGFWVIALA